MKDFRRPAAVLLLCAGSLALTAAPTPPVVTAQVVTAAPAAQCLTGVRQVRATPIRDVYAVRGTWIAFSSMCVKPSSSQETPRHTDG